MKQITLLLTLTLLISCGASKNGNIKKENDTQVNSTDATTTIAAISPTDSIVILENSMNPTYDIKITITKYIPYCGGAAPSDEMMNNYKPVMGEFILVNHTKGNKHTVKSNQNGILNLKLPLGEYSIRETYKNMNFSKFYNKQSSSLGNNIKVGTMDCYESWWKTNLVDFKVNEKSDTLIFSANISQSCYTGTNPCDRYTGPYPP